MKKNLVFLVGLFILVLVVSGCNSDKKIKNEITLIMDTIIETESNQYYYHLIESLLANEQDDELLKLAEDELNLSANELDSLSIKTKKGKEVINNYQNSFENREKVISILKEEDFTEKTKESLEKYIIEAEDSESAATEIIIDELKLKDIES